MNQLLFANLPVVAVIIGGTYAWYRTGFRTPRFLRLPASAPRRMVIVCGWTLVIAIVVKSFADPLFGDGRVQIAQSGQIYAHRTREPVKYWGEIAGELLLVGGTGAVLIALGRRRGSIDYLNYRDR